jgi:hypothetical protein
LAAVFAAACRDEVEIFEPEVEVVAPPDTVGATPPVGFYLLNEGNMSSNKSTLDYFDFATGTYHRNIFAAATPCVPMEMGDVGNDIAIYGSKLYAVINCSNKVEVVDKLTARRLGQIDVPNCRYIKFHEGYAYVTSYAGQVEINPDYEQTGYVAKIDTATLREVGRRLVGIYLTDAAGFTYPGTLYCYDRYGKKKWEAQTGDIPGHFALLYK